MNVAQGILRARYRDSFERPSPLEAGRPYRLEIDCWSSANLFRRGHRIRVEIASSNFPSSTGTRTRAGRSGRTPSLVRATQTVYHDAQHPSHILLPLVD